MNQPFTIPPRPRPVVLALHCTGGNPRQWEPLAQALAGRATLHAPVLPPFPDLARPSLAAQAAPLVDWLGHTAEPVHVVGHSHGGALALHLARRHPERVASLSLYEPAAFHLLRSAGTAGVRALQELSDLARTIRRALAEGRPDAGARRFVTYWGDAAAWAGLSEPARTRIAATLDQGLAGFTALTSEAPGTHAEISCDVLLIHGKTSTNPARLAGEHLASMLSACRCAEIAGAAHMGPLTHPGDVSAVIASHLFERDYAPAAMV